MRIFLAVLILTSVALACATGSPTPRPSLYPSETVQPTQTPAIVIHTSTPLPTYTPVVILITPETVPLCVDTVLAVHLRPSPSDDNYPITAIPNKTEIIDLGGRSGSWIFVQVGNDTGWINKNFLGDCK